MIAAWSCAKFYNKVVFRSQEKLHFKIFFNTKLLILKLLHVILYSELHTKIPLFVCLEKNGKVNNASLAI
jgi:hypothetical protein